MQTKLTFRECTMSQLDKLFSLQQMQKSTALNSWLAGAYELSEFEKKALLRLQEKLNRNVYHWNEQELVVNFVYPVFTFVNFTTDYFNDFAERLITVQIGNHELSGRPDGIIATGFREPEIPFFCFQEYKPESDPTGEPYGQCLAAMLAGQTLNNADSPIYGCVVKGADWNFMILEDKKYTISKRFVADDDEVFDIFRILQCLKNILSEKYIVKIQK